MIINRLFILTNTIIAVSSTKLFKQILAIW